MTGERASAAEIAERAFEGDAAAEETLARYEDRLARGLASVVNVVDPEAIVLGGGMSNIDELYADLPGALASYTFSPVFYTPIVRAAHGDSSGVRGAARLWSVEEI